MLGLGQKDHRKMTVTVVVNFIRILLKGAELTNIYWILEWISQLFNERLTAGVFHFLYYFVFTERDEMLVLHVSL